jgi:hypothetical protein
LLRAGLLVFGGVLLVAAAIATIAGCRPAAMFPPAVLGVILAGGVLIERWRYRPLTDDHPGQGWQATRERFVDPESGRLVTVFFNPATGERRYVAQEGRHLAARSWPML